MLMLSDMTIGMPTLNLENQTTCRLTYFFFQKATPAGNRNCQSIKKTVRVPAIASLITSFEKILV